MSDSNTATVNFSDVASLRKDKTTPRDRDIQYIALENIIPGMGRLKGSALATGATSQKSVFHEGDILFNKLRPYLRKYWLATFDGICSTELLVIQAKETVDRDYLYHAITSDNFINYIDNKTFGTKMPRADWDIVKNYRLSLPPIENQRQIAFALNALEKSISCTFETIEQVEQLKKSLLQDLINFSIPTRPLSDYVEEIGAGVSVRSDNVPASDASQSGVLKTSAVSYLTFNPAENKTIHSGELGRANKPVSKGTILVSRMNTPELVGANVYIDNDYPNLFLPDRIWELRIKDSTSALWLNYVLQQLFLVGKVGSLASGTSRSMRNISQAKYLNLPIPDIAYAEQQRIANTILAVDTKLKAEKAQRSKQEELKQGLLHDLITSNSDQAGDK